MTFIHNGVNVMDIDKMLESEDNPFIKFLVEYKNKVDKLENKVDSLEKEIEDLKKRPDVGKEIVRIAKGVYRS